MGEELISNLQKKGEGEVLIIDGETIFEESDIDGNGMYLYVFYCFFLKEIPMDMSEEQLME